MREPVILVVGAQGGPLGGRDLIRAVESHSRH
jgi:hypothetical protein